LVIKDLSSGHFKNQKQNFTKGKYIKRLSAIITMSLKDEIAGFDFRDLMLNCISSLRLNVTYVHTSYINRALV